MEHTANFILTAIITFCMAQIFYLLFQSRKQRLKEREALVNHNIVMGVFESESELEKIGDGYILRSLWRLSHVRHRAEALGYQVDLKDCYAIVTRLKNEFLPDIGISTAIIDATIKVYIREQIRTYRTRKETAI